MSITSTSFNKRGCDDPVWKRLVRAEPRLSVLEGAAAAAGSLGAMWPTYEAHKRQLQGLAGSGTQLYEQFGQVGYIVAHRRVIGALETGVVHGR